MVREQNVKLMSKIAIYEKNKGRQEIPMNSYYKGDYVRIYSLKAVVHATIAFVLIAAIVIMYKLDYILTNILKVDYKQLAMYLLIIYVCFISVYWLASRIVYARRYEKARPNIIIYNHDLKKLREVSEKEVVKSRGGVVIHDDFIDF